MRRHSLEIWMTLALAVGLSAARDIQAQAQAPSQRERRASQPPSSPLESRLRGDEIVNDDHRGLVEGGNRFALDLYARLREGQGGNLFFSPSSLSEALAMAYAGAGGETAREMAEVLRIDLRGEELLRAVDALRASRHSAGEDAGYELSVANRLWGQQDFDFRPDYLALTREHFGAELLPVDFVGQTEATRGRINDWVQEQTRGKIKDLIPSGALNEFTRLVLTNAIHFKGAWTDPFREEATKQTPFHLSDQREVDVPMMSRMGDYRFLADDGLKVLEMPYGRGDLAMVILLPEDIEGLAKLEATVTHDHLARWLAGLRLRPVRVSLPRFSMTSEFELGGVLSGMGMGRAFTPEQADFSGMSREEGLSLTAVLHKAFVDVNEQGTEAAAATGIAVGTTSFRVPQEPATFRADHPFLFLIRDRRTGSLLFLGRLVDPEG